MTASEVARPANSVQQASALLHAASTEVEVLLEDRHGGRVFLLLHGGGGPVTMTRFADLLAERTHSRVLLPTHPGFAGTSRPAELATTRDLAALYLTLLDAWSLSDVTVLGNSFGGWVAAEIALLNSPRVSGAVIVDGIGIEVEGHPLTAVNGLSAAELQRLSFHDPSRAPAPPQRGSGPGPDVRALLAYTGPSMSDPTLLNRLGNAELSTHVLWGEGDGIVDVEYGKAYASALPGATFTVLPRTGHLPQLETPEELLAATTVLGVT